MSWQPLQNHIEHEDMKSLTYLFFTNIGVIHCEPGKKKKENFLVKPFSIRKQDWLQSNHSKIQDYKFCTTKEGYIIGRT